MPHGSRSTRQIAQALAAASLALLLTAGLAGHALSAASQSRWWPIGRSVPQHLKRP
jgi:hypothetical protein